MTKLYRIVSYVIGLNGESQSEESVRNQIQGNRHPEFHYVKEISTADIGEWHDGHEANKTGCDLSKFFPETKADVTDQELLAAYKQLRLDNLRYADECGALRREARRLSDEINKLQSVKEFVKTIGDLTR